MTQQTMAVLSHPGRATVQNVFSADITMIEDPDEGLRVECLEPHLKPIGQALVRAKFTLGQPRTAVPPSTNIPASMELPVADGTFDDMKLVVYESLVAAGVKVTEEDFSGLGEKRVRFNLENVSLFGQ